MEKKILLGYGNWVNRWERGGRVAAAAERSSYMVKKEHCGA